jgi:hypothetical protein
MTETSGHDWRGDVARHHSVAARLYQGSPKGAATSLQELSHKIELNPEGGTDVE